MSLSSAMSGTLMATLWPVLRSVALKMDAMLLRATRSVISKRSSSTLPGPGSPVPVAAARRRNGGLPRRGVGAEGHPRRLRDLLPVAHLDQLEGDVVVAAALLGQGDQLLAGVVGMGAADDLPHLLVEDAGVEPVGALQDEVAVAAGAGSRSPAGRTAPTPRLRVSSLRLGLAMAWRSSIRPSLTGTDVATWSVVSRRIVFCRMK